MHCIRWREGIEARATDVNSIRKGRIDVIKNSSVHKLKVEC